jgi:hypothetical protein
MDRSSVFIGSSSEGLNFARAVRAQLEDDAEISLWNEDFFGVGSTFIETLVNALPRFDFAILVLTPDDLVASRSDEKLGPRDNVIFELGLFMGKLGRTRTFFVHQSGAAVKIPTDLSGVTRATYQWPRQDNNYRSAVGSACDAIRKAIRELGMSEHRASKRINEVAQEQHRQAGEIDLLTSMLIRLVVTEPERRHLQGLAVDGQCMVDIRPIASTSFENEIRRLIALRLIHRQPEKTVRAFFSEFGKRDAKEYFFITDRGHEYLKAYEMAR